MLFRECGYTPYACYGIFRPHYYYGEHLRNCQTETKKAAGAVCSCSVYERKQQRFLFRCCFMLFLDFHNFLCRCGDNFQSVIAHAVQQSVKLTPLCILFSVFVRKEKLIYRYGITGNKLIKDLQARLLSLVLNVRKAAALDEIKKVGRSNREVAQEHDIPIKTLEKWITAYNKDNDYFEIGKPPEETNVKQLERQIARLKRENEILKKTIALLGGKE